MERRLAAILAADVAGYSRMMAANERVTLAALQQHRAEVLEPEMASHHGRIVKLMGDGILAEFASIVEAVDCAARIQQEMAVRNSCLGEDARIAFRIGVHLGDVIVDGEDLYGDGVNIAARLEGIAEVGGVCISAAAQEQVEGKLDWRFRLLGPKTLKNIPRPITVYAIELAGTDSPRVQYCRTPEGVRLAYAIVGTGANLVRCGSWFTHLEHNWEKPTAGMAALKELAKEFRLLRYDARGNGMSDWEVEDISLNAWVSDLATVVNAAQYDRFALLASSQAVAVAIAYAAANPNRVSRLILYGGYAQGWRKRPGSNIEQHEAMMNLMRLGWGSSDPSYRQLFTSQFMPNGTMEQWEAMNELQRISASAESAVRYYQVQGEVDVTGLLSQVKAPTLVMHVRDDLRVPFESGRQLAAAIAGARFVALPGRNHVFQPGEPAHERYLEEIRLFLV